MTPLDDAWLRAHPLPVDDGDTDKDGRGRVLVVGGSREVPGAVLLAAAAALHAGAGKLQVATIASIAPGLGLALPEALVIGLAEDADGNIEVAAATDLADRIARVDAALIGPGMMGTAAGAFAAAIAGIEDRTALVLDAAALHCPHSAIRGRSGPAVLTPHAGEMARLLGTTREAVHADPGAVARDAAARLDNVIVLKGSTTILATPGGALHRYTGGGIGLATSGSGDVLAGILAGLLARGAEPLTAAGWAVYLHGEAGRRLARSVGRVGFLARELLGEVPRALAAFEG